MTTTRKCVLAVSLAAIPLYAAPQAPIDAKVRSWAAGCTTCHGPGGRSEGGMPSIAGRKTEELYGMLVEYREGRRSATVMHQHARGYTPEELRMISQYFAEQRP